MSTEREKELIRELLSQAEDNLRISQDASMSAQVLRKAAKKSNNELEKTLLQVEADKLDQIARDQFDSGQYISNRVQEILGDDHGDSQ